MSVRRVPCWLVAAAAMLGGSGVIQAQSVLGANIIVNGDAESGPGSDSATQVASIPGWTNAGGANVLTYASKYGLTLDDIIPAIAGKNYFSNGTGSSSLTQSINLTSGAAAIDAGTTTFAASGYFGGYTSNDDNGSMTVAFLDAAGKQLASLTIGGVKAADRMGSGLYLRRQIGPVPVGVRSAKVTVTFVRVSGVNNGYADNLSLVLNTPVPAQSLYGSSIIINGDAERGSPIVRGRSISQDVPGWVRSSNFTTESYGPPEPVTVTDPGPPDRGKLYFSGGDSNPASYAYQDIDVSSLSGPIDAGSVKYALGAWIGGWAEQDDNTILTVQFRNWTDSVVSTAKLGPVFAAERGLATGLLQKSTSGSVPAGTRMIRVQMDMTRTEGSYNDGYADSLSLILSAGPGVPTIAANGVVTAAAFGGSKAIGPGTWIEIYGQNLAPGSREWAGADFSGSTAPTTLDGVSVSIANQPAYMRYMSPGQVNVQVPSGILAGQQQLVVSTPAGSSAPYAVTVNQTQPGVLAPAPFVVGGKQYVAALFPDGATFVLPPNTLPGVPSRQAKPGETILIYGIGFGPTSPNIGAGQIVSQANTLATPVQVTFAGSTATLTYSGLAPNFVGLYQFNIVVPDIADGDLVPLVFSMGGVAVTQNLYTAVRR